VYYPKLGFRLSVDSITISGDVNNAPPQALYLDANAKPLPGDNKAGDPKLANNPSVKPAVEKALTQDSSQNVTVKTKSGDANVLVVPISTGALQYALLFQSSFQGVEDTLTLLQRILILTAVAVTLLSACGAWFLTGRVLEPIDRITDRVQSITARDLSQRLEITQPDEIGRMAATFNDMIARLQASFERQKRFTSDASHELRTPLAVMQADISLALRRPRTVNEYKSTLESAQEEVTRLSHIVSDLLTLTRLDADVAQIARQPVALDELVGGVVSGLRPLATDKSIALTFTANAPAVTEGDVTRLKQLFINLVDNALIYTPEGGSVRVDMQVEADQVTVTVADTGMGVEPEYLPHIFERFYRTDEARSRNQQGTGLGLAIAQSAAQAHHGQITVSSTLGRGTTFAVILPLNADASSTRETTRPGKMLLLPTGPAEARA
jgi:heavy metal sensor kinase